MTLTEGCVTALARAGTVTLASLCAGWLIRSAVASHRRGLGPIIWTVLLLPYLTPSALTGYAWSNLTMGLVRFPWLKEPLYMALLWMKLAPLAAVLLYFAPGFLSPSAIHCHRLVHKDGSLRGWISEQMLQLRSAWRACAVAAALVFLLAFEEFELASLMGVRTWTVSIFDANAGGLSISASLGLTVLPLLIALAALAPTLWMISRARRLPSLPEANGIRAGHVTIAFTTAFLAISLILITLIPCLLVVEDTAKGAVALFSNFSVGTDIAAGLAFAATAALAAWTSAGFILRRRKAIAWAVAASIPGLFGALTLALVLMAIFQIPLLRPLYDKPIPLFLGLTLLLLPFAALMRLLLEMRLPSASLHSAELMEQARAPEVSRRGNLIARYLRTRGRFWALALLFLWGYFDVAASAILAPVGMTPIFVRLYNFMHYGRMPMLSAMIVSALIAPALVIALAGVAVKVKARVAQYG